MVAILKKVLFHIQRSCAMGTSVSDINFLEEKIKELTLKKNDPNRRNPKRILAFQDQIMSLVRQKENVIVILKGY